MATNMYLNFENPALAGESTDSGHADWIEILSWSHSFNQPTSPVRSSAGGGTVERANHSDLTFTKYIDSSTDDLLKQCWTGKHVGKATIQCYRSDGPTGEPQKYLEIVMEHVVISNYSISAGAGDIPIENVSLSYGIVQYNYNPQDEKTGENGSAQPVKHDLMTNTIE